MKIENQPSVIKPLCSASVQVTPHSFGRLGPEGLLNDQLIAHFLYKWAVESPKRNTLCLEPYFARFLFSDDAHLEHKQVLNETEKLMSNLPTVLKVCLCSFLKPTSNTFSQKQGIKSLDHCFLVINEDNRHWYSAIIDFTQHKIAVNDSLPSWKRRQIIPVGFKRRKSSETNSIYGIGTYLAYNSSGSISRRKGRADTVWLEHHPSGQGQGC